MASLSQEEEEKEDSNVAAAAGPTPKTASAKTRGREQPEQVPCPAPRHFVLEKGTFITTITAANSAKEVGNVIEKVCSPETTQQPEFRVSGFGLRASDLGLWGSGCGFRVWGFVFRISSFG